MDFSEATILLKEGKSIRRKSWPEFVHLKIIGMEDDKMNPVDVIQGYRQEAVPFNYDTSIILSNDWVVIGNDENELIEFPAAVEMLKYRRKIRLKEWPIHTFLELHPNGKELFMRKMCEYDYTPSFECFAATDWETME